GGLFPFQIGVTTIDLAAGIVGGEEELVDSRTGREVLATGDAPGAAERQIGEQAAGLQEIFVGDYPFTAERWEITIFVIFSEFIGTICAERTRQVIFVGPVEAHASEE